jgi:hypothetical protein
LVYSSCCPRVHSWPAQADPCQRVDFPAAVSSFAVLLPPVWHWSQHTPGSGFPFLLRTRWLGSSLDLWFWRWFQVPHSRSVQQHTVSKYSFLGLHGLVLLAEHITGDSVFRLSCLEEVQFLSLVFLCCRQIQVCFRLRWPVRS